MRKFKTRDRVRIVKGATFTTPQEIVGKRAILLKWTEFFWKAYVEGVGLRYVNEDEAIKEWGRA